MTEIDETKPDSEAVGPGAEGSASRHDASWQDTPASSSMAEAIERMELQFSSKTVDWLDQYCRLLWDWNTKINLTRHTDYDKFVRRDLLDTVRLAELLKEQEDVLDIGTGGGVPGLVLAIIRPDLQVSVCDSVAKKSRVLQSLVGSLGLHVPVYAVRVQDVLEDMRFHSLTSRAVGSIRQQLNWLMDHWLGFDRLLAIKGPRWTAERGEARHHGLLNGVELRKLSEYVMPGTDSQSVILEFRRER